MKTIMCFGDSNTYGINPETGMRFGRKERWTGVLQELLGEDYDVIEEGLPGRTTVWEDPLADHRCGLAALPMLLDSHAPLDWVILMLGNNDLKHHFSALPEDVASGIEKLTAAILRHPYKQQSVPPEILLISPAAMGENIEDSRYGGFREEAVRYSRMLPELIRQAAVRYECAFFEAGLVAEADPADKHHMNRASHRRLAEKLAEILQKQS